MKFFAVVLLFAAAAMAVEEPIEIIRHDFNQDDHHYTLDVETGNGISASQKGMLKEFEDAKVVVVEGSFSYIGEDGMKYTVNYVADENGFQPMGAHFPVSPVDPHHH